ncbi:hypothetical protein Tco_0154029 [Tanacetum coccineum]
MFGYHGVLLVPSFETAGLGPETNYLSPRSGFHQKDRNQANDKTEHGKERDLAQIKAKVQKIDKGQWSIQKIQQSIPGRNWKYAIGCNLTHLIGIREAIVMYEDCEGQLMGPQSMTTGPFVCICQDCEDFESPF